MKTSIRLGCSVGLLLFLMIPHLGKAQTFTTLMNFTGSNGSSPLFAPLIQGTDGNLYGTASAGGEHGQGTVFKITPTGTLTTMSSFCALSNCADGSAPYAGLMLGIDGNLYGTTESGGAHGAGAVFKITQRGTLTTLHSFNITDGYNPYATLVQGTDGNFYGTTESGGVHLLGTVVQMTPQGTVTTLHSFNSTDGSSPEAALIQSTGGNFYGTTYNGGTEGYGTIFKITSAGTLTTLHVFDDATEGRAITAGLVQASDGNFYGSTTLDGPNGYGAVYTTTPTGTVTVLHGFNATDGATPNALVLATDGNFYDTTISGGANIDRTVFQITPQGTLPTLHTLTGTDGADSFAGVVQHTNGKFYGTTRVGGSKNDGTVFRLDMGLGPFVKTVPTAGKVGVKVKILGTSLTGATSVNFNGVAATFTVVSATEITTTVPTGATTGTVQVVTPGGTLLSNVAFQGTH